MVERLQQFAQFFANQQKIDYQRIFVERRGHLGRDTIIVSVQAFALAAERDEVRRAEHMLRFGDSDAIIFRHDATLQQ